MIAVRSPDQRTVSGPGGTHRGLFPDLGRGGGFTFLDYYKFREQPFGVTPDPRYLYLSRTHREVLASLYYSIEAGRGFSALIAKPGMGKTTLLFRLMERVRQSACTAFLFQTQCNSHEFFNYLLSDMGIDVCGKDLVTMHEQLNQALVRMMRANMRFVLIIDEAQNLEDPVLETVRMLSNFETPQSKLMQIILSGQPQLAAKLVRPSLAQLRQRIAILCRLSPLRPEEIDEYIDHRLRMSGYTGDPLFTSGAQALLREKSEGIPRNINNLCFNALSLGCALKRKKIDEEIMQEVAADMDLDPLVERQTIDVQPSPEIAPISLSAVPSGSFQRREQSDRKQRPWRAVALANLLLVISLISFSSVRKLVTYHLKRHSSAGTGVAPKPIASPPPVISPHPALLAATPPAESALTEPLAGRSFASDPPSIVVEVRPGETIYHISLRYLGRFDREVIEEIRKLNPEIDDPNVIEVGQLIRLPRPSQRPTGSLSSTAMAHDFEVAPGDHP